MEEGEVLRLLALAAALALIRRESYAILRAARSETARA